MGAVAKLLHVMGMTAKPESVYGTPVSLSTSTDGQQLQYANRNVGAPMSFEYAADGTLGPSISALGQTKRVAPTGYSIKGDLPMYSRPGGAAYSSSVVPSMHNILKACGFDATLVTTSSAESWTYAPSAPGNSFTSLTAKLYTRGELWAVAGMIGSLKMDAPDTKPAIWTMSAMGLATLPTDISTPTITYPLQTVAPPLASSVAITLGNLTTAAEVLSHSFDMQRQMTARVNQSASGGHRGFVPGDRSPQIKITLEATALTSTPYTSVSAFDPYRLLDSGQNIAVSVKHGTAQYFQQTINFPQCQVIAVTPGSKDSIATVELTIQAYNSTASAIDDVTIVFD